VHRDVKPGNVLITPTGGVKVTDFGIARAGTSEALTQTGSVMGTATYFSPEQAQGQPVDGRSDVYSLGVVLYEMVTGVAPFTGDTPVAVAYKHVREAPVPPTRRNPDVPAALEQIILTAMHKDPAGRYQTAEDLRADLLRFRRGRPLAAAPVTAMVAEVPTTTGAVVGTAAAGAMDAGATMVNPRVAELAPARSGSSRAIAAALTVLVLGLIVALVFVLATNNSEEGRTIEIPDVVGLDIDEARGVLETKGFEVDAVPVTNEEKTIGEVLSQDPLAGDTARTGTTVTLEYVSVESKPIPRVEGLTVDEAKRVLADAGFTNISDTPGLESSDLIPAGAVLRTDPAEGEVQDTSVEITIVVSAGREQVPVPNVLNQEFAAASNTITDAGFTVSRVDQPNDEVDIGRVIDTNPGPNEKAPKGSAVTVYVSSGPAETVVPSVIGRTESSAISRLEAAGFEVVVNTQSSTLANDGRVIAQSPVDPATAAAGATITITVGVYEPPPTTASTTTSTTVAPGP
jgi:serine/threonine-protein kinase